jgi:hypothetical protein
VLRVLTITSASGSATPGAGSTPIRMGPLAILRTAVLVALGAVIAVPLLLVVLALVVVAAAVLVLVVGALAIKHRLFGRPNRPRPVDLDEALRAGIRWGEARPADETRSDDGRQNVRVVRRTPEGVTVE